MRFSDAPDRLTCIVNYALFLHTFEHDYTEARVMYAKAELISQHNPTLLYAHAIFRLASCEHPRRATWDRSMSMLREAKHTDPTASKFAMAKDCFFMAVVRQPSSSRALTNWALVLQCIMGDVDAAETFHRRAVAANAEEPDIFAVTNLEDFMRAKDELASLAGPPPSQS